MGKRVIAYFGLALMLGFSCSHPEEVKLPRNIQNGSTDVIESKIMTPESYPVHHLLTKDSGKFLSFYNSQIPIAIENYRKYLIKNTRTYEVGGEVAVSSAISAQKTVMHDIVTGVLQSREYNLLNIKAKHLVDEKTIRDFIALESFDKSADTKDGITYFYRCIIVFGTKTGCFIIKNISNEDTLNIHKCVDNIQNILHGLSTEKWVCTLNPFFITEGGMGNVVLLTQKSSDTCRMAFMPNLPVWNIEKLSEDNLKQHEECQIFLKTFKLFSQAWQKD